MACFQLSILGYGKVSPYTNSGKIFCSFFASVGIPITLVFSSVLVSICMHPIRKSREGLVTRFCGSEDDSVSYMWPSDYQDKSHYHQQLRSSVPDLSRDPFPCFSEPGSRKKPHPYAVHFDQMPKGSPKSVADLGGELNLPDRLAYDRCAYIIIDFPTYSKPMKSSRNMDISP